MAQEIKEEITIPLFETTIPYPPNKIKVAESTNISYQQLKKYINDVLDVTNNKDKKKQGFYIPPYTYVDYRLWLLNIFKNIKDGIQDRPYIGSEPDRIINNPTIDDVTKKAFEKFYNENTEKIESIEKKLDTQNVTEERELEKKNFEEIKKKKIELNKKSSQKIEQKNTNVDESDGEEKNKEDKKNNDNIDNNHNKINSKKYNRKNNLGLRKTKKLKKRASYKPSKNIVIHCLRDRNGKIICDTPANITIGKN